MNSTLSTLGTSRCLFLVGILVGVCLQLPYIHWLEKTPQVVGEPVPTSVYSRTTRRTFVLNCVPYWIPLVHHPLRIIVASSEEVNAEARWRHVASESVELLGFYDSQRREIWCVDSIVVLIHELRHVFEGSFHR